MSTSRTADVGTSTPARAGLALLMVPIFMAALDMTVLFLAIPTIAAELLPTGTQQLWVLHVGDIAGAGLVLTAGRLVDRFGPRTLLVVGMLAYGSASAMAAFAPSVELLILARMLLGASAVTMAPAGMALLRHMFPAPRQFTRALALFMAAFSGGMALGPPLGGLLLENFWWGSIFLVNVPIAVAVAVLAPRLLPAVAGTGQGRIDLASVLASSLGIAGLVYGGQELAATGWDPWSGAALAAGLVLVVAFVLRQRTLPDPLLDLGLFRYAPFALGVLAIWLVITATAGADLQFAQHLRVVLGHSALTAGALLVVPALASVAATAASPALLRWLRPGHAIALGAGVALLGALGMVVAVTAGTEASTALLVGAAALVAAGVAPVFALGTGVILSSAPVERTGSAQATQEVGGSLGNTAGLALGGTVAYLAYSGTLRDDLPVGMDEELARQSVESVGGALDAAEALPPDVAAQLTEAAQTAFTVATRDAYLVAVAGLLAVALMTFRGLRNARLEEDHDD
ncbi:major facilitator superfamily MFS_1 [Beutenbergia cavernae DSM 12333]|uniref:Major facilitator superfamily MFS_1 n=1 Tax=Beutenbergia cavernae (strain ATCC BAA-8 / DSM 12333 / CCUG 43141 / JCM 11478 / NBRC 16432 / NCIMB 13614 / HKI 0122) TaxID=471853 RepID=C5C1G5_BEUC1|nr:MFS transporter [Beutenbergia cavernae]ACQ81575.1 major facilitator superfamily MFS_1 [Beutenbergia cavernae DSM 12333]